MVAPITWTIRGAPSAVVAGIAEGLKKASAVNLDHVQIVAREALRHHVGSLGGRGVLVPSCGVLDGGRATG